MWRDANCWCRPEVAQAIEQQNLGDLQQALLDEAERYQALTSCGLGPLLLADWLSNLANEEEVRQLHFATLRCSRMIDR